MMIRSLFSTTMFGLVALGAVATHANAASLAPATSAFAGQAQISLVDDTSVLPSQRPFYLSSQGKLCDHSETSARITDLCQPDSSLPQASVVSLRPGQTFQTLGSTDLGPKLSS